MLPEVEACFDQPALVELSASEQLGFDPTTTFKLAGSVGSKPVTASEKSIVKEILLDEY